MMNWLIGMVPLFLARSRYGWNEELSVVIGLAMWIFIPWIVGGIIYLWRKNNGRY